MLAAVELGDLFDDLQKILAKGQEYVPLVLHILEDPALPRIRSLVEELRTLEQRTTKAPAGAAVGVGLRRFVKPLEVYVYHRKHRWFAPVVISATLGLPLIVGLLIGRARRR